MIYEVPPSLSVLYWWQHVTELDGERWLMAYNLVAALVVKLSAV